MSEGHERERTARADNRRDKITGTTATAVGAAYDGAARLLNMGGGAMADLSRTAMVVLAIGLAVWFLGGLEWLRAQVSPGTVEAFNEPPPVVTVEKPTTEPYAPLADLETEPVDYPVETQAEPPASIHEPAHESPYTVGDLIEVRAVEGGGFIHCEISHALWVEGAQCWEYRCRWVDRFGFPHVEFFTEKAIAGRVVESASNQGAALPRNAGRYVARLPLTERGAPCLY